MHTHLAASNVGSNSPAGTGSALGPTTVCTTEWTRALGEDADMQAAGAEESGLGSTGPTGLAKAATTPCFTTGTPPHLVGVVHLNHSAGLGVHKGGGPHCALLAGNHLSASIHTKHARPGASLVCKAACFRCLRVGGDGVAMVMVMVRGRAADNSGAVVMLARHARGSASDS